MDTVLRERVFECGTSGRGELANPGQARAARRRSRPSGSDCLDDALPGDLRRGRARGSQDRDQGTFFGDLSKKIERKMILAGERADGRRSDEIRADHDRPELHPAPARLRALHARRDAGPGQRHAGHSRRRADHRWHRASSTARTSTCTTTSPPYSVGETRRIAGPGRREIGHGMLAERALISVAAAARSVSPTRSASSPTSWSRTAAPRWRASAADVSR